jgi:hypothetical protein
MSSEEKERQEAMELIEKIPGHIQKFLDGSLKEDAVIKAYAEIPPGYAKEARKKLIGAVIDRINLETPRNLFDLVKKLLGEKDPLFPQIAELAEIRNRYEGKAGKLKEEITQKIAVRLAEKNISGDAILVVPEETPAYESLTSDYEKRIGAVRQYIAGQIQQSP